MPKRGRGNPLKNHFVRLTSQGREATKESDIDVVIISEKFRNKDILERVAMTKEAEIRTLKKFMIPLDIITLTPDESERSLIASYARDAEVVSAK